MQDKPVTDGMEVLIFRMMGATLGTDVEQISRMIDPSSGALAGLRIVALHEKIRSTPADAALRSPTVLLLKNRDTADGVLVDCPGEIRRISLDAIRPLPLLVERSRESRAIWGVALIQEEMVLLVDLVELASS